MTSATRRRYFKSHNDGSRWARGWMVNGKPDGRFVWYRKDGSKLRTGNFTHGKQSGKWITYDRKGNVVKVTIFKGKQ